MSPALFRREPVVDPNPNQRDQAQDEHEKLAASGRLVTWWLLLHIKVKDTTPPYPSESPCGCLSSKQVGRARPETHSGLSPRQSCQSDAPDPWATRRVL